MLARCTDCAAHEDTRRHILWDCLPIKSYGDVRQAQCVTVGLNPADNLFYKRSTRAVRRRSDRLPMLEDFGAASRPDLSPDAIKLIEWEQHRYFTMRPRHPWFRTLEQVLQTADSAWTYESGRAAHLDTAACATDQWVQLSNEVRRHLQSTCHPHFLHTLTEVPAGAWLILNGRAIWNLLLPRLTESSSGAIDRVRWSSGNCGALHYFAWNISIQRTSPATRIAIGQQLQAERLNRA